MKLPDELKPHFELLGSLQRLNSRFEECGVVIDDIAASVLGKARFTEDIDVLYLLSDRDVARFLDAAQEEGIEPRIQEVEEFAKKNHILLLRHTLSKTKIDVFLGVLPFEQEVVQRSIVHEFEGKLRVRLPTPEDLIIMKAIASRPKDLEDIRVLVEKYPKLDAARIEYWVKSLSQRLEAPSLWDQIREILSG